MTDSTPAAAARRWPILFAVGLVVLLAACFISRYARADWTGALVGVLAVIGSITVFCAGLSASDEQWHDLGGH